MPYFEKLRGSSYYCPNCECYYETSNTSCTVMHSAGDCCHEHERKLEYAKGAEAVGRLVDE